MNLKILLPLISFVVVLLPTVAADVTGIWKAQFDTQLGLQTYTFTLKQDGTRLTGKASAELNGEKREANLTEAKVEGDTVSFVEPVNFQGIELRIAFTGKISANEIKLIRQVGNFSTTEGIAKRNTDPTPSPSAVQPTPPSSKPGEPTKSDPGRRGRGGFGGPIILGPDDKPAFPPVPEGFDTARDSIAHGQLEMVEYDSKTVGIKRKALVYTPPRLFAHEQVSGAVFTARHWRR